MVSFHPVFLVGCIMFLVASYTDELDRKVIFSVPLTVFMTSLVFRMVYSPFTLHYFVFFTVSSIILGITTEILGGWTRGDTWIFIAAVSALPTYWYNTVIPIFPIYFAGVMLINSILAQIYKNSKKGVPGIHSHTANYIYIGILIL